MALVRRHCNVVEIKIIRFIIRSINSGAIICLYEPKFHQSNIHSVWPIIEGQQSNCKNCPKASPEFQLMIELMYVSCWELWTERFHKYHVTSASDRYLIGIDPRAFPIWFPASTSAVCVNVLYWTVVKRTQLQYYMKAPIRYLYRKRNTPLWKCSLPECNQICCFCLFLFLCLCIVLFDIWYNCCDTSHGPTSPCINDIQKLGTISVN